MKVQLLNAALGYLRALNAQQKDPLYMLEILKLPNPPNSESLAPIPQNGLFTVVTLFS